MTSIDSLNTGKKRVQVFSTEAKEGKTRSRSSQAGAEGQVSGGSSRRGSRRGRGGVARTDGTWLQSPSDVDTGEVVETGQ